MWLASPLQSVSTFSRPAQLLPCCRLSFHPLLLHLLPLTLSPVFSSDCFLCLHRPRLASCPSSCAAPYTWVSLLINVQQTRCFSSTDKTAPNSVLVLSFFFNLILTHAFSPSKARTLICLAQCTAPHTSMTLYEN